VRVFIETMGCRTNVADSSLLATQLVRYGATLVQSAQEADLIILNSCTVTHRADRDTGKMLRRFRALEPRPRIVVLGCLPQATPDHPVLALADLALPGWELGDHLPGLLGAATVDQAGKGPDLPGAGAAFELEQSSGLSRVNIKICQGCAYNCTYCIVPSARGRPASLRREEVFSRLDQAAAAGFMEVVLSGTHILDYGADLGEGHTLTSLVEGMLAREGSYRVRFGSVEPGPQLRELALLMRTSPRLCRHLHVAIQHSSDAVLRRMGRRHGFDEIRRWLNELVDLVPEVSLGLDFIVGFPGETQALFDEALEGLHALPFTYMHVFSFSPRPGTPAAQWLKEAPPSAIVKERSAVLRSVAERRRVEAAGRTVGSCCSVLVERVVDGVGPVGHTDTYFEAEIRGQPALLPGAMVQCRVVGVRGDRLLCEVDRS